MNLNRGWFLYLFVMLIGFSCGDDSGESVNGDPRNFQIDVTNLEDGMGNISIQATGDNITNFEFDPGDGNDVFSNSSGIFSYTYQSSGTYTIVIKAFGESGRFLSEEATVAITIDAEEIPEYDGFELVWNDEFNGSEVNSDFWNFELGTGNNGWGNNELQYYRKENTEVTGGNLVITARQERFSGRNYTSSRLTTEGKYNFKYGRVDINAKLPEGSGLWPALWMLGANFSSVGWPNCGEIDIMEMFGFEGEFNTIKGTLHWEDPDGTPLNEPGLGPWANFGGSYVSSTDLSDNYHVYSIIWTEQFIEWRIDNNRFHIQGVSDPDKEEFQKSFFFIFNVAVGGNAVGTVNDAVFPQQMLVDYVRVYQSL